MIKKSPYFQHITTLAALVLGSIYGLIAPPTAVDVIKEATTLFMRLLKLLSAPMIFLAITSTLTQMENVTTIRFLLRKIFKYTLFTTLVAALVGLFLFLLIKPSAPLAEASLMDPVNIEAGYFATLKQMIPDNVLQPFLDNNVIALALIAALLSLALQSLPREKSEGARSFFRSLFEALLLLTSKLIPWIPLAIFAFTAQFVVSTRAHTASLTPILWYALCVIAANLIQGLLVLPLLVKAKNESPLRLAKGMMPALVLAFLSKSSNITLPVSLECATSRLNISSKTARFSFPLCSIINMNGCAAFILITLLFVSHSYGVIFTPWQMGLWVVIATCAAIGNAGVPMGCFFLTSALLVGIGLPLDMMGMILPLYALFDMVETALNVWSDSCVTALVDRELIAQANILQAELEPK